MTVTALDLTQTTVRIGRRSPPREGADVYRRAKEHSGVHAFRRFADQLSARELSRERLLIFFASMTAFVRYITPGIPALAVRLSDELYPVVPYRAHGIAAHILDASMDEYGLTGTKPHAELLRDFALHFELTEDEIMAPENAVPAANELGDRLGAWYRKAPVAFGLGVHTASEVTGYEEAYGFHRAFLTPPKYGITPDLEAFTYVKTHVENEGDHSTDVVLCLDEYIALQPEKLDEIVAGNDTYMVLYDRMFREMSAAVFG